MAHGKERVEDDCPFCGLLNVVDHTWNDGADDPEEAFSFFDCTSCGKRYYNTIVMPEMQDLTKLKNLDADIIIPRLWQGGFPGFGDARRIARENFDVIVLCAEEFQLDKRYDSPFGPEILILKCPMHDADPPRSQDLLRAEVMSKQVFKLYREGKRILITCAAGLNRSGLVTALSLRLILNLRGHEAVSFVQEQRMDALCNRAFASHVGLLLSPTQKELECL